MVFHEIFNMISLLSPYLIPLYLLMSSFFNQDIKGLFYLVLLTINVFLTAKISGFLKVGKTENTDSNLCKFGPFDTNSSISVNSSIIGFTLGYLVVPMFNNGTINYGILTMFLILLSINGFTQAANKCCSNIGIVLGSFIGLMIGYITVVALSSYEMTKHLIYFYEGGDNSNKCKLIKQKYTCKRLVLSGPTINDF
jgi:hypothetical protein